MVKARVQSKTLNHTDPFYIDQITLPGVFTRFRVDIIESYACCLMSVDDFILCSVSVSKTRIQQK